MSLRLLILPRAVRELARLSHGDYERVRDAVHALSATPFPHGSLKLVNRKGRRIRVGRYRVIYEVDPEAKTLTILHIGLRKDIYRV